MHCNWHQSSNALQLASEQSCTAIGIGVVMHCNWHRSNALQLALLARTQAATPMRWNHCPLRWITAPCVWFLRESLPPASVMKYYTLRLCWHCSSISFSCHFKKMCVYEQLSISSRFHFEKAFFSNRFHAARFHFGYLSSQTVFEPWFSPQQLVSAVDRSCWQ